mmetsp:Transcript_86095/g.200191  ORF Transcript_86095/g.200191 Transcript_86095/m.200191 type:complete len:242 (+) Transcript_86095:183-908(+)
MGGCNSRSVPSRRSGAGAATACGITSPELPEVPKTPTAAARLGEPEKTLLLNRNLPRGAKLALPIGSSSSQLRSPAQPPPSPPPVTLAEMQPGFGKGKTSSSAMSSASAPSLLRPAGDLHPKQAARSTSAPEVMGAAASSTALEVELPMRRQGGSTSLPGVVQRARPVVQLAVEHEQLEVGHCTGTIAATEEVHMLADTPKEREQGGNILSATGAVQMEEVPHGSTTPAPVSPFKCMCCGC